MLKTIRTHLVWKVFLSYVVVVLVGVIVLVSTTSLSVPAAFNRHMAGMSSMMSRGNMVDTTQSLEMELFATYQASVNDGLSLAIVAALVVAVLASFFISRQVVGPIQQMKGISQRVAEGDYHERLNIGAGLQTNQLNELDQLALSFNQMADKLEKTEIMRRQLLGDVSHELRTPLTAIKGYMEGLIDGVLPASPETYQQVYTEADRLQRLVNDLQELSRVEAGVFQLQSEPISMNELIDTIVGHLGLQFEDKGVRLDTSLADGLPQVVADKDRILQVLTNLVGNALQYTQPPGKVRIETSQSKDEVLISIIDTGIGIPPEHIPYIFNRFYRIDKSRARVSGGSGIGLTIAQSFVKAHRGRIWAESAGEGKGSSFHFSLPIAQASLKTR